MHRSEATRAVAAARSIAAFLGLAAEEAVVLHDSNKLTVRLLPCDVVARVAPNAHHDAQFEVELAQQLLAAGCPVAAPDPRVEPGVRERDGFTVTLWTHYEPTRDRPVAPGDYVDALARLHAGMRSIDLATPHCTARVREAQRLVATPAATPALDDADRQLLGGTLTELGRVVGEGGVHQVLHGEPHPGNLLTTKQGLLFIDLETCCRGPVEFDLAHAPNGVGELYPGVDHDLLRACRLLMLAMITTWRWDKADRFPNGRRQAIEWLRELRARLDPYGLPGA